MANIYDQHDAAFRKVAAYVVLKDGERVATIAFKFPANGAGRLFAYVHWIGVEMVRGHADGGGYDKRSAACSAAARKITPRDVPPFHDGSIRNMAEIAHQQVENEKLNAFRSALLVDGGKHWDDCLRDAGFTVFQAV